MSNTCFNVLLVLKLSAQQVVVVVGLEESLEEEGTDRMDSTTDSGGNGLFQLPGAQQQLVDSIVATGTPVVQVLLTGGPLSVAGPNGPHGGALLNAGYGGQACGDGLASVLFGETPPSGKTTVTYYDSPQQAGNITSFDMTAGMGRTYRFSDSV
jgi:beta-glucosidase